MPGESLIIPALGQAEERVNALGGAFMTTILNRAQRKWTESMYGRQRTDALADWNMQNEYNSPSGQMARLKAAGLNPNLVYGNGATVQSANVRSSDTGSWRPETPQFKAGAGAGLMDIYDIQLKEAQIDNVKAATTVQMQERQLKEAQTMSTLQGTDTSKFDLDMKQKLSPYQLQSAEQGIRSNEANISMTLDENERRMALNSSHLREAVERILLSRSSRSKNEIEKNHINQQIENLKKDQEMKELDLQLMRMGVKPGSPWYVQMVARFVARTERTEGIGRMMRRSTSTIPTKK